MRRHLVRQEGPPHGLKFIFRASIPTPKGTARIRTVWLLPPGQVVARFITAVPD